MKVVIGARKSALSRVQAYAVGRALREKNSKVQVEFRFSDTLGDNDRVRSLSSFGDRGVFTEDIARSLKTGDIDMAVHSWKDLPTADRVDTVVAATLPRADCRDLLLIPKGKVAGVGSLKLKILTCSPRRVYNLKDFLTWALPLRVEGIEFAEVRGNVDTRIKKLLEGDAHGLIVAKAALDRLLSATEDDLLPTRATLSETLQSCFMVVIPLSISPAAPAQGALAIEVLRSRHDMLAAAESINDQDTFSAVSKERAILASYGGGCHQKIGASVLRRSYGEITYLRGLTDQGEVLNSTKLERSDKKLPRAESRKKVWPDSEAENFFDRREVQWSLPSNPDAGFLVARADAWPENFTVEAGRPVWAAGLTTWRKLAARGVWVTGCAESLGESESPQLEMLMPRCKEWIKLTHAEGTPGGVATYKLVPRDNALKLDTFTHFFWKSGSAFKLALEKNPALRKAWHGCGPGHTYDAITSTLGSSEHVGIYLSFEDFLSEVQA